MKAHTITCQKSVSPLRTFDVYIFVNLRGVDAVLNPNIVEVQSLHTHEGDLKCCRKDQQQQPFLFTSHLSVCLGYMRVQRQLS